MSAARDDTVEAPRAPEGRSAYRLYRLGSWAAGHASAAVGSRLARWAGAAAWRLFPDRAQLVEAHMRRASGTPMSEASARRLTRAAFVSYARYWFESLRLPAMSGEEIERAFSIEGLEHIRAAQARGRGAILAIPHVGGWDVGGAWLVRQGIPLTVVAEPLEPPELLDWFIRLRRGVGLDVIVLGPGAGTAVLRALRDNQVVALLCDRDIVGGGLEVEFFGEPTTLPAGPATLALRTGAALLPTAVYFDGAGHRAVVRPPLNLDRQGRFRDDLVRATQLLARELEALIRRAPEQWHLFQPNWPSDRL